MRRSFSAARSRVDCATLRRSSATLTALRACVISIVALRRAAHQLADDPRVFDDPIALQIVGAEAAAKIKDSLHDLRDQISKPLRAFFAVRSRYAEDQLKLAIDRGVTQYVILGAGLDTFAYRNIYPPSTLHIFELDHPATQAWKKIC